MIKPRTLSGFMELLPEDQILFNRIKETIKQEYEKSGFVPLDTPILELSEIMLAKAGGETEKQIYELEKGDNKLCLRFDLTVPLAKYVAEHQSELSFPFKRYQIGKVYRGERAQKGRFREFYQCDIDIVGNGQLSLINDAEVPSVIYNIFKKLNIGEFCISVSNRKLLLGLFEELNLKDVSMEILRVVDKFDKIGEEEFVKVLTDDYKLSKNVVEKILNFIKISGTKTEQIEKLKGLNIKNVQFLTGIDELETVLNFMGDFGIPDQNYKIDLKIARGLDYYTGTVYETFVKGAEYLGSVSSGGRYDDLAKFYTNNNYPGVGMSIGLTRLFYQLRENKIIKPTIKTLAKVVVLTIGDTWKYSLNLLNKLKQLNVNCEIYPEDVKFKNKLQYVLNQEIPFAIIVGEDEVKNNEFVLKDLNKKEQYTLKTEKVEEILNYIK